VNPPAPPWRGRRLHFVGVGGAGISGYARVASELGAQVSGSDSARSTYTERLAADGVLEASVGQRAENVPDGDDVEVVYSSAVGEDNPERVEARRRGIPERPRAEILAELSALRATIAVAGTHGKTTTASMAVHALRGAGLDPGWLLGGTPGENLPNARWGGGEWLVVEADESDRSMLSIDVDVAVLTNAELDHHATFTSLADLREAFRTFLAGAHVAMVVWDEPDLLALAEAAGGIAEAAGDTAQAAGRVAEAARETTGAASKPEAGKPLLLPYRAHELRLEQGGSEFRWRGLGVKLRVPGRHNAANASAALEAARLAGADGRLAAAALSRFAGAARRFELLGESEGGALVYDDYAHHPSEVSATLDGARTLGRDRLIAVFQPHLYTRTAALATEFGRALATADVAVVLEVYPARERADDHPGVSGLAIAEATADAASGKPVYWLPTFAAAEPSLRALLGPADVCVVMGAGDVDQLARHLVAR
jgi:UDP-N-acetylmuramate--alanine ligase